MKHSSLIFGTIAALAAFAAPQSYAGETENAAYDLAVKNGVKQCLTAIEKTTDFITKGQPHAVSANWHVEKPNDRIFSVIMVIGDEADPEKRYVNFTFSPVAEGGCDIFYSSSFNVKESCSSVREEVFAEWRYEGDLNGIPVLGGEPGNSVVFIPHPAGGCTVFRSETLFLGKL
jgi:hypothetical protein